MINDDFKAAFAKVLERAGDKARMVVRKSVLHVGESMIQRSPVDTGRFRANWQFGLDTVNVKADSLPDASGIEARYRMAVGLDAWSPGQKIFLTNSLPYARRLEYGYSNQAPGGMVRLAAAEFKQYLNQAAQEGSK